MNDPITAYSVLTLYVEPCVEIVAAVLGIIALSIGAIVIMANAIAFLARKGILPK